IPEQCDVHNRQFQSVSTPRSPLSLKRLSQIKLQDLVDEGKVNPGTIPTENRNSNRPMPDIQISENGILKLLNNLKPGKAAGPDGIRPVLLKELRVELAPIIKVIFERSLQTGKLPADWCKAKITPIFKKGDKSLAANYRPISLTCILCRVLEHILASNIVKHLDEQGLLYDLQHGFREKRSCETQLIMLVEDLARSASEGKQTDLILLDFSKAFDKVNHAKLLWKLHDYGIRSNVLNWIRAFLGDRSQRVVVAGEESGSAPVTSGVPQGSVLGPILFLIYINDLPDNVTSQVRLFADDTALYLTLEGAHDSSVLQRDLDKLSVWETDWDMEFNPSKCQVVQVTGSNSKKPIKATYKLHGEVLETVTCAKYLGVDISSNLSWGSHIDRIVNSANKTLGFVRRNVQTKIPGVREAAYNTLVRPQLEYAAAVWDPHHDNRIKQIEKVQRRAARWTVCNYDTRKSVSTLLETLGWQSLEQRRAEARLCLFYKIINNMVAVPLPSYVIPNPRTSRGHSKTFQQLHTRKDFYKYSFFPLSIVQWNDLPESAVSSPSLDIFKAEIGKLQHAKP
ncbi:MAG: reverse transcriptase family protein, partial [Candidatus Thiodiazotropha taylori]|nr:reverse transcriptase family protein [Candidatus Thiodiazotropha taylori]MCW4310306.1 reverse transcriptase family protein [Candidatus Thiodiazotropha endolucinida]